MEIVLTKSPEFDDIIAEEIQVGNNTSPDDFAGELEGALAAILWGNYVLRHPSILLNSAQSSDKPTQKYCCAPVIQVFLLRPSHTCSAPVYVQPIDTNA